MHTHQSNDHQTHSKKGYSLIPNGELLQAHAHVWNQLFNFINSFALKWAVQLGIPDIIHKHGRPMIKSELLQALPIHKARASFVPRLMRTLVHSGFFIELKVSENDQDEGYLLTPPSCLLLKDEPLGVTPFLLASLDTILTEPWHRLSEWFQNDRPTAFETARGRTFWDYAGQNAKPNHFFNESMASDARLVSSVVIRDCPQLFDGIKTMVDVGGGTGTVAKTIAEAYQHLHCVVLDLPHVVDGLQGTNNLSYVGGDIFDHIPPADAVLLKTVKILKKCKEAIPSKGEGGKVIMIDMIVGDQKGDRESTERQLFFDMLMMVLFTGTERNEKEWAKLFFDSGFSDYKITSILGLGSVIEVYP